MVAHNENTFLQSVGKGEKELARGQEREAFGAFDVFPDGLIEHSPDDFESRGSDNAILQILLPIMPRHKRAGRLRVGCSDTEVRISSSKARQVRRIKQSHLEKQ